MTSLDQFRTDIAQALYYSVNDHDKRTWEQAEGDDADYYRLMADEALQALTAAAQDAARLRVVLEVIGLEVREGTVFESSRTGETWFVDPPLEEANEIDVLVCRVRPREEKADGYA